MIHGPWAADRGSWSAVIVHDKLDNGRSYKMLTVLDEYTRQALAVTVRTRMTADDVLEALYPLLLRQNTSAPTTAQSSSHKQCRTRWQGLASSPSGSIPDHPGRTDTTNASMAPFAVRCSMLNGSAQQSRPRSSSTIGSGTTTISARIRPSTRDRQCQKL